MWKSVPLPHVAPGTVLDLGAGDWEYGQGPLRLRVDRVREDLNGNYGGEKMWVEGWRLDESGTPVEAVEALIRTSALPRA